MNREGFLNGLKAAYPFPNNKLEIEKRACKRARDTLLLQRLSAPSIPLYHKSEKKSPPPFKLSFSPTSCKLPRRKESNLPSRFELHFSSGSNAALHSNLLRCHEVTEAKRLDPLHPPETRQPLEPPISSLLLEMRSHLLHIGRDGAHMIENRVAALLTDLPHQNTLRTKTRLFL
jgi:hypothetical protein